MWNRFTAIGTVVDHDAKAFREVELTAQLGGDEQEMPQRRLVFGGGFGHAGERLARQVCGRVLRRCSKKAAAMAIVAVA